MAQQVAIVAASPRLREAIAVALADDARWSIEACVASAAEIDGRAGAPDLIVAELGDGIDAAALDDARLVLLGDSTQAFAARALADRRPIGLLPRDASAQQLRAAVAAVLEGLLVWHGQSASAASEPPGEPLTPRELEVFELVAKGLSNPDIAAALGISAHTAKFHVGQILAKIGAASRAEAVGIGLKLGLIGV